MSINTEFASAMQAQIARWDSEVETLASEARKADGELKTAFQRRLKELRLHRAAAQKSLDQVRAATEAAGEEFRGRMQAAWDTMQAALVQISADLRKPAVVHVPAPPPAPEPAIPTEEPTP